MLVLPPPFHDGSAAVRYQPVVSPSVNQIQPILSCDIGSIQADALSLPVLLCTVHLPREDVGASTFIPRWEFGQSTSAI